ncbi:hypothetical protein QTN94_16840 [Vibrio sp. M250220]|uniref:hypothetical protein n=1 Tax=Vibrio sp. M250220 TaxID=3020894 RepID=UPI002F3E3117
MKFSEIKSELEGLNNQQLRNIKQEVDKILSEMEKSGQLLTDEELDFISALYKDEDYS